MSSRSVKFWLGGTLVSLAGVALARIVAPGYAGRPSLMVAIYLLGVTLGITGLGIITFGTAKDSRKAESKLATGKEESNSKKTSWASPSINP